MATDKQINDIEIVGKSLSPYSVWQDLSPYWDDILEYADKMEIKSGSTWAHYMNRDSHKIGCMGEHTFTCLTGVRPNLIVVDGKGDKGVDFTCNRDGFSQRFTIDVKASTNSYATASLLVKKYCTTKADIYVHTIVNEERKIGIAMGWIPFRELSDTSKFPITNYGNCENHDAYYPYLRKMEKLLDVFTNFEASDELTLAQNV